MRHTLPMLMAGTMVLATLAGCARKEDLPASPEAAALSAAHFSVSGVVINGDGSGDGLDAVDVRLTPPGADASQDRTLATDATGAFEAEGLAGGNWTITISKPGFKSRSEVISVTRNCSVTLDLVPAK